MSGVNHSASAHPGSTFGGPNPAHRRVLITAGPTHEPIDAVRYIGNRSSGRVGMALATECAARGWTVTLLLGPIGASLPPWTESGLHPAGSHPRILRFRTTTDLQRLLAEHWPGSDILIMAAAVADYRPKAADGMLESKIRRTVQPLTLELEPTPDLLAACGQTKRPDQMLIGFALEPRERLDSSAREKLTRKRADWIVANPLETMDAPTIDATVYGGDGIVGRTGRPMAKESFAAWLVDLINTHASKHSSPHEAHPA